MDNEEITGVKFSEFPSATPGDSDEVVGLHNNDNARFPVANFILAIRQGLANIFVPLTRTINGKALSSDITLDASDVGAVDADDVGVADGVASLDINGKVPGTQLDLSGKQDTITASGILKGDGAGGVTAATAGTDYQAPLTIDATPTANSTNPVQSGGVYDALAQKVPMTNPSYGPYTASGGTMDVEYYYKSVGEMVYVTGAATPTATVGITGRSDVTFSDLPKDIAAIPVFMSANNCTVSSSDLRPVLQMAYLGGKGFRFQGQATLNRAFQFSIIYS